MPAALPGLNVCRRWCRLAQPSSLFMERIKKRKNNWNLPRMWIQFVSFQICCYYFWRPQSDFDEQFFIHFKKFSDWTPKDKKYSPLRNVMRWKCGRFKRKSKYFIYFLLSRNCNSLRETSSSSLGRRWNTSTEESPVIVLNESLHFPAIRQNLRGHESF